MLEIVRPKLREMRPKITETAIQEAREAKLVGSREDLNKALNMRVAKLVSTSSSRLFSQTHAFYKLKQEQKKLVAEHNVSPIKTMAVPVLSQLPLFVLSTAVVYRMCQVPTPLDSESFLSLTSLSHVDPTGSIPIALGMLTFINVDSSSWFASAEKLQRDEIAQEKRMEQRQQGNVVALDSGRFKGFLRLTSVGRIVMGMIVPGVSGNVPRPSQIPHLYVLGSRTVLAHFSCLWSGANLAHRLLGV
jgi:inner membrane protein COX18